MLNELGELAQSALDLLFPPHCAGCGEAGALLCTACMDSIRPPREPLCPRCGRSLATNEPNGANGFQPCPTCAHGEGPQALVWVRAAAVHEGAVREAVLALKYGRQRRLAVPLGDVLAAALRQLQEQPDVIVPVPLHTTRRSERGFDQAQLLARRCSARLRIPCEAQILVRQRATQPQVGLSAPARRENVAGAFALLPHAPMSRLAGKRILLLDDVATTGSTLDAAAQALLLARPAALWGFAITRPHLADDASDLRAASLQGGRRTDGRAAASGKGRDA